MWKRIGMLYIVGSLVSNVIKVYIMTFPFTLNARKLQTTALLFRELWFRQEIKCSPSFVSYLWINTFILHIYVYKCICMYECYKYPYTGDDRETGKWHFGDWCGVKHHINSRHAAINAIKLSICFCALMGHVYRGHHRLWCPMPHYPYSYECYYGLPSQMKRGRRYTSIHLPLKLLIGIWLRWEKNDRFILSISISVYL